MKKVPAIPMILAGIIVVLAVVLIAALLLMRQQQSPIRGVAPILQIAAMEADSSLWGQNFPNQYSTFMMTETNNTRTTYGGSDPFEKTELDPLLKTIFAGNAFAKGYGEDRGHVNAVADVRNTPRINDKTPGTCYSCKSSDNPKLWDEMGMAA